MKNQERNIKVSSAKGRPMLNWVGKKPLDLVKGFPVQPLEIFNPTGKKDIVKIPNYDDLKDNWQNLLFHGDNKDTLATLLELGFRGKIDLIYIDPPFKSGADYVRKVMPRGIKNIEKLENAQSSVLQQTMYFDMWNNDEYLQFIYERLLLLKELLSETGSIYVHLDWGAVSYIKCMMDEIFGEENYKNSIIWEYQGSWVEPSNNFPKRHQVILFYVKNNNNFVFNRLYEDDIEDQINYQRWKDYIIDNKIFGKNAPLHDARFKTYYEKFVEKHGREPKEDDVILEFTGSVMGNVWYIKVEDPKNSKSTGFKTQKPEALMERIIRASSNEEDKDLILDCFIGSGTTAAVAQKLGKRWIGCDINKGAIQLTSARLQKIINEQLKEDSVKYPVFGTFKVNNYDLKLLQTEAVELAIEHVGVERLKTDNFFDGTRGKNLVKIIDFNHPLTLMDLQLIQDELGKRPNEDRNITVICLGKETAVDAWIEDWNKKHPVNKIEVIELKTDSKYGNFLIHKPAEAKVNIERKEKSKAVIEIQDFISPTIIERLNIDSKAVKAKIPDFRSMIDCVLIDTNYDNNTFNIDYSDVPERKDSLVEGEYEFNIPEENITIAVKIIDMLGEEVMITKEI